jgi:hypothetical protein
MFVGFLRVELMSHKVELCFKLRFHMMEKLFLQRHLRSGENQRLELVQKKCPKERINQQSLKKQRVF